MANDTLGQLAQNEIDQVLVVIDKLIPCTGDYWQETEYAIFPVTVTNASDSALTDAVVEGFTWGPAVVNDSWFFRKKYVISRLESGDTVTRWFSVKGVGVGDMQFIVRFSADIIPNAMRSNDARRDGYIYPKD